MVFVEVRVELYRGCLGARNIAGILGKKRGRFGGGIFLEAAHDELGGNVTYDTELLGTDARDGAREEVKASAHPRVTVVLEGEKREGIVTFGDGVGV